MRRQSLLGWLVGGPNHGHKGMFVTITSIVPVREAEAKFISNNNDKAQKLLWFIKRLKFPPGNTTWDPHLSFVPIVCDLMLPFVSHMMVLDLLNCNKHFIYVFPQVYSFTFLESSNFIFCCYLCHGACHLKGTNTYRTVTGKINEKRFPPRQKMENIWTTLKKTPLSIMIKNKIKLLSRVKVCKCHIMFIWEGKRKPSLDTERLKKHNCQKSLKKIT